MRATAPHSYDDLARAAGLEPLGAPWTEVDSDSARTLLASILHKDLAYDSELMPATEAQHLAHEFVGSFDDTARFAVNGWVRRPRGWASLTDYTFDAGVVVSNEAGGVIYCVADED